ncbi:hypothetical protein FQR65_LT07286 [Abscondita terminalis]|nr:hypothetical protein FQR65_LT07286 [Abscondita terminalis]
MNCNKQESSEDCILSTNSSSIIHYTTTPTTYRTSRKRKFSHDSYVQKQCTLNYDESPAPNIFSSTLNESLSKSLEKCCLNYTPNFYVERSPEKRYKLDDSPKFQPKTRSAPSTPTKYLEEDEEHVEKSRSEPLGSFYFVPEVNYKLGAQEKFALLYPNIHNNVSPAKVKTPEKLREFLKKVNSPAKKQLFEHVCVERRITDPIVLFTVNNDFRHIVSHIFKYLSENDLCVVSRVSRIWRKALQGDLKAFARYFTYSQTFHSNKENIIFESINVSEPSVPPLSPETDRFRLCTKIASRLSPSQSLRMCLRCMEPAVIQKSISQCQNPNCQYISCTNCLSFSLSGPENFIDKCHMSELIVTSKSDSFNRSSLYDISNGSMYTSPSFLCNDYHSSTQSKLDSGYISECDMTSSCVKRNYSVSMDAQQQPLQPVSINKIDSVVRRKIRNSSLVSVVSAKTTPSLRELDEPSSPPKVKIIAGSKQSKKNLKRLQF